MNIEEVQRRLWEQSKEHKGNRTSGTPLFPTNPYDLRIRKLMDLMHNPTWICEAARRVLTTSRGKAAGVDGMTASEFQANFESQLETLRMELKRGTYQPTPVRQVLIPKADGTMRPLGIPCLRDKIVQEAIRMALEPIFEVEFHDSSYGFRPNRSTHQAVCRCRLLMQKHYSWVIEGDVKACFEEISHQSILKVVREKVMDNKFLDLIQLFLKAGISKDGTVVPTVKGVPQGGVISPLLANAVLNKLDWFLHEKGTHGSAERQLSRYHGRPNYRFVRYADDWCVFIIRGSKALAERLRNEIGVFLRQECGLRLSDEKTHVTHVRDGFEFLGFRLECGIGRRGSLIAKVKIGLKAVRELKVKLDREIRHVAQQVSISARIYRANLVLRGWAEYFRLGYDFPRIAHAMDHYTFWTMVKAICRQKDIPTGQCLKQHYHSGTIHYQRMEYLGKLSDKSVILNVPTPKPYEPEGANTYETDEMERREAKVLNLQERKRPGTRDLKLAQLQRDDHQCRKCGKAVTHRTSHLDHIEPVNRFASFEASNATGNLQTLCWDCHHRKTHQQREGDQ